jgi:hypothetical protein
VNSLAAHRRWCALFGHSINDINKGITTSTPPKPRDQEHVLDGNNDVDAIPGVASDQLPNSFDTLQAKVDKYFRVEYNIKRTVFKFPSSFSTSDVNVYEGHYAYIMPLIGDMLLDFVLKICTWSLCS